MQTQLPGTSSTNSQENEHIAHLSGASSCEDVADTEDLQEKYCYTKCSAYNNIDICEEIPE